jgi:hypothetical protein
MTQPTAGSEGFDDVPLDEEESLDSDALGQLEDGSDPLDDGWDAPDTPSPATRFGYTAAEQRDGESLDELLAEEVPDPDPYAEAERLESGPVLDADVLGDAASRYATRDRPTAGLDGDDSPGDLDFYRLEAEVSELNGAGELVQADEGAHDSDTGELTARGTRPTDQQARPASSSPWPAAPEDDAVEIRPDV